MALKYNIKQLCKYIPQWSILSIAACSLAGPADKLVSLPAMMDAEAPSHVTRLVIRVVNEAMGRITRKLR